MPQQRSATSALHKPGDAKAKGRGQAKGKVKAPTKKKPTKRKTPTESDEEDGDDGGGDDGDDDGAEACAETETPFELLCRLGYGAPAPSGAAPPAGKQRATVRVGLA